MTDQAATLSVIEYQTDHDPVRRRWFYLGAALVLFVFWQAGTAVGVLAGAQVPDGLQLEFIIPLMFTALAVPALTHRPAIVAAVVSVAVTVISGSAGGLPPGTNILAGGVAGVIVGALFVEVDDEPLDRPTPGDGPMSFGLQILVVAVGTYAMRGSVIMLAAGRRDPRPRRGNPEADSRGGTPGPRGRSRRVRCR